MDIFIEKLFKNERYRGLLDNCWNSISSAGFNVACLNYIPGMTFIFIIVIGYVGYLLITSRNIEYEYAVTNGDLDIDKIIAQRKRREYLVQIVKEFEIVAKLKSSHYSNHYKSYKNQLNCASSWTMKMFISLY